MQHWDWVQWGSSCDGVVGLRTSVIMAGGSRDSSTARGQVSRGSGCLSSVRCDVTPVTVLSAAVLKQDGCALESGKQRRGWKVARKRKRNRQSQIGA
ncbi:hypothetical protein JZ751_014097 [Albula glossodonta]|uniref:Uncharacterized protein n=1 Tax=Albula glossodonta TaxID=121402 RepID=A0A8T2NRZ8_9TELE|nr:hypothetical protein JZ751_014097 [Albula glossodonta]